MHNNGVALGHCVRCEKTLRAIGTARVGGKKTHGDWPQRSLHKKCWKEEQAEQAAAEHAQGVMDRLQNEPLALGWSMSH